MSSANRPATRLATRLSFLVAGFGIACWAPLVPFAKQRLAIDDGTLGLLLLCLGVGSVVAMLLTGFLSARYGSKPIIIIGGLGLAILLPLLPIANSPLTLGFSLFVFGASLGSIDVAMNIHAVEVERAAGRPLMSGFHALFSVGGFAGSTLVTSLLSLRLGTLASTLICSVLMLIAMLVAWPRLIRSVHIRDHEDNLPHDCLSFVLEQVLRARNNYRLWHLEDTATPGCSREFQRADRPLN